MPRGCSDCSCCNMLTIGSAPPLETAHQFALADKHKPSKARSVAPYTCGVHDLFLIKSLRRKLPYTCTQGAPRAGVSDAVAERTRPSSRTDAATGMMGSEITLPHCPKEGSVGTEEGATQSPSMQTSEPEQAPLQGSFAARRRAAYELEIDSVHAPRGYMLACMQPEATCCCQETRKLGAQKFASWVHNRRERGRTNAGASNASLHPGALIVAGVRCMPEGSVLAENTYDPHRGYPRSERLYAARTGGCGPSGLGTRSASVTAARLTTLTSVRSMAPKALQSTIGINGGVRKLALVLGREQ